MGRGSWRTILMAAGFALALALAGGAAWAQTPGYAGEGEPGVSRDKRGRWEDLSPEKRERLKESYERYKGLPPEEQKRLRERMERWRSLTPQEREARRGRMERFRELPPQKREMIKERMRSIRELPPEERRLKRRELRRELEQEGVFRPRHDDADRGRWRR